jgi:hypothetical protein
VRILSVDLALTAYSSIGIVALERSERGYNARALLPRELGLAGAPDASALAGCLVAECRRLGVSVLLLDGPQGWKHPANGLSHSRVCERRLNTPGKTGLPGRTKPASYLPFISFSVDVFRGLAEHGFELFSGEHRLDAVVVESFPTSAWRQLGLPPLPAKARSTPDHLDRASRDLQDLFGVPVPPGLSHDELQALVAAFAGVALHSGSRPGYAAAGDEPTLLDGTWREGFIVNPTRLALAD